MVRSTIFLSLSAIVVFRDALEWSPFVCLKLPMRCLESLVSDPGTRTGPFRYANLVASGGGGS